MNSAVRMLSLGWCRFTLRHWRRELGQTLALVLLLGLGVGTVLAIRAANRAAVEQFESFTETVAGGSDWILRAPGGRLPVQVLRELRSALGPMPVTMIPVLEGTALRPEIGETLDLLGIDLVAVRNYAQGAEAGEFTWLSQRGEFAIGGAPEAYLSADWGVLRGERIELLVGDRLAALTVAGVLPERVAGVAVPGDLILLDLPDLQRLLRAEGTVDRVELNVAAGPRMDERRAELGRRLSDLSDSRWVVEAPENRRARGERLTAAFRYNLQLLALIALIAAAYLVAQALDGAVVRRRQEIGIQRTLGWRPGEIYRAWLIEAGALGFLGSLLGVVIGWGLAQGAVGLVAPTVNALYVPTKATGANLTVMEIAGALLLGTLTSLLAGWWPAREAARTPPVQVLRSWQRVPRAKLGRALLGAGLFAAVAVGAASLPGTRTAAGGTIPLGGYGATFAVLAAGTCLLPLALRGVGMLLKRLRPGVALTFAASRLRESSSRHRWAAASLLVAVAIALAMAQVLFSFEGTLRGWMESRFRADAYFVPRTVRDAESAGGLSQEALARLASRPEVAAVAPMWRVRVDSPALTLDAWGVERALWAERELLLWTQAPRGEPRPGEVWISESLARQASLRPGDALTLAGREFRVAAVFADYASQLGAAVLEAEVFRECFRGVQAANVSVFLRPGADAAAFVETVQEREPGLSGQTQGNLRELALGMLRQTFAITQALKVIALAVALAGLGLGLYAILLQDRPQWATLRELGWSRPRQAWAAAAEGLGVAVAGALLGVLASFAVTWILIAVVNLQSFGWTLQWQVPWQAVGGFFLLVVAAGGATGYLVAWRRFCR